MSLGQLHRERGGKVDREKLDSLTDADIARMVAKDPDAPPLMTDADLERGRVVRPYVTFDKR
jgi:hypothetical protein